MRRITIIDYGSGNLRSVAKAFEKAAEGRAQIEVTDNANALQSATHIVLPGVGAFGDCMRGLSNIPGMREAMEEQVRGRKKPFLGICVGMQMLLEKGYEHGEHAGLGWIAGDVVKLGSRGEGRGASEKKHSPLAPPPSTLKIPHMGWNDLIIERPHPLLEGLNNGDHAYFVHSYHAQCTQPEDVLASVEYGGKVAAVIGRGNILGTQFHPEKSQKAGLRLLANFMEIM